MDFKRNTFLWINIVGLVIIAIIIIVGFIIVNANLKKTSEEVKIKLDGMKDLLFKLEENIKKLEKFNEQIKEIKENQENLKKSLNNLSNIEQLVNEIIKKVNIFNNNQSNQNLIINNINKEDLNKVINNAVEIEFENVKWKINLNLILNIVFGAIFSLGGFYIMFKLYSKSDK